MDKFNDVDGFKEEVLKEISQHHQLEKACKASGDGMELYHRGHVLAYKRVHETLVRWFSDDQKGDSNETQD